MTLAPLDIHTLLRRYNITAKKSLGQNFLIDDHALRKIVESAEVTSEDSVLEIGAGLGSLTRYLANAAAQVVAVELDKRFLDPLQEVLVSFTNVKVIQGDILELDPSALIAVPHYLVVANIPYYITSAVIRHLLEADIKPNRVVLTIQKEVAQRVCAVPDDMNLLALGVQVYGKPSITGKILAGAFFPAPDVDSAVVRIDLYDQPLIPAPHIEDFFRLAKAGFGQKRKTLRNSLSAGLGWPAIKTESLLASAGIDPQRRAETLSMPEWGVLVEKLIESR
ncbi:MAG TPA: 16S rRNA (adenine(1518)-N(6)/adenine(1519)-N(6))-dimethyltransferase RsmA [Longilinea sp.]|nr:16S rRNA (adenine(1518)-N(6)/adenine(1519)-N(6))-dimethyltransferase RsmA [Longilinea sp.]